jgi:metalloendopeptidase OMA1, mitochondrial
MDDLDNLQKPQRKAFLQVESAISMNSYDAFRLVLGTLDALKRRSAEGGKGMRGFCITPVREFEAIRKTPAFLLLLFAVGCATVPITGRKTFNVIPESQEMELGAQSYQQVLTSNEIIQSGSDADMVKRVGQRIANVANKPEFKWEFNLIRSDDVNAFCLPGGKVAVYTGILPIAQDDAGLATVMGHEIGHAVARHGGERMTDQLAFQLGGAALSTLLRDKSPATQQVLLSAYGAGGTIGVLLPFSRRDESEADHIGLVLMARAGYDPRAALSFWQRMEQAGGKAPPEFLSTHPSHGQRIQDIEKLLPEAETEYEKSPNRR